MLRGLLCMYAMKNPYKPVSGKRIPIENHFPIERTL